MFFIAYATTAQIRLKSGLSSTADVSDADLTSIITLSDAEVDNTTGQSWGNANAVTEYYSIYPPKRADDLEANRIVLLHFPVQSITAFTLIDSTGTAYATLDTLSSTEITAGTYQSADYYCDVTTGLIELNTRAFDFVPKRAKISYTYGYSTTPTIIGEISSNLGAIRAWVKFLGGNYDRLNEYKLPEQEYKKGDFYDRGLQTINSLTKNTEDLFNQIGKKQRSQLFATGGGYF